MNGVFAYNGSTRTYSLQWEGEIYHFQYDSAENRVRSVWDDSRKLIAKSYKGFRAKLGIIPCSQKAQEFVNIFKACKSIDGPDFIPVPKREPKPKGKRKAVIARIKPSDLLTVGSGIEAELRKPAYGHKVGYEQGHFYIVGRENVKRFVEGMKLEIAECRKYFKDTESLAEFEKDEAFLAELLKIKAT